MVRPKSTQRNLKKRRFNPRTYIRYDLDKMPADLINLFQSTYLYKVRLLRHVKQLNVFLCFNPRTYIRYDFEINRLVADMIVSIHVPI